jgi:hypothetical protein
MEEMNFEKAEYQSTTNIGPCANCNKSLDSTYYQANGMNVCEDCANILRVASGAPGKTHLAKGAVYAVGAAFVCSAVYAAIIVITNFELGLIAIAVGWIVGRAARIGAAGLGSRPLQIIAVAATYMAISGSLFFQVVYELNKEGKAINGIAGYVVMFFLSMGKPLFELSEGFGGIIGLVILFFGLQQAWQNTRALAVDVAGPYNVNGNETLLPELR